MYIAKRRLRREDASGRVTEVGFSWFEPRLDLHWWYGNIVRKSVGAGVCLVPIVFVAAAAGSKLWFVAAPCCALGFAIAGLARLKMFTQPLDMVQGLTFDSKGRIQCVVPQYYRQTGTDGKFQPEWVELRWTIDQISSIELASEATVGGGHFKARPYNEDEYFAYVVSIYFNSGEMFRAARTLRHEHARIVVVQLNRALAEIKSLRAATLRAEVA